IAGRIRLRRFLPGRTGEALFDARPDDDGRTSAEPRQNMRVNGLEALMLRVIPSGSSRMAACIILAGGCIGLCYNDGNICRRRCSMKDFNYYNTFITIAPDSAAAAGTVPAGRGTSPTAPQIQYELLAGAPYTLTQEALYYHVHLKHKGFSEEEIAEAGTRIFDEL